MPSQDSETTIPSPDEILLKVPEWESNAENPDQKVIRMAKTILNKIRDVLENHPDKIQRKRPKQVKTGTSNSVFFHINKPKYFGAPRNNPNPKNVAMTKVLPIVEAECQKAGWDKVTLKLVEIGKQQTKKIEVVLTKIK